MPAFGRDAKGKPAAWIECLETRNVSVADDPLRYTILGHEGAIHCVTMSPDDRHFLTGGEDKLAKLWDTETGTFRRAFSGHSAAVQSCALFKRGGVDYALTVRGMLLFSWVVS